MTAIQWTQQTWNPIVGCSVVSHGCTNCYAMRMAWRLANNPATPHYHGTVKMVNGNPVWTGKVALAPDSTFLAPLRRRIPTTYFVNSMGDLFHESVPYEWIARVFEIMERAPQHRFQVLTKRAARMRDFLGPPYRHTPIASMWDGTPLPNVHLGVSAEDQARADERIPDLLATPAAVRFVSYEPALGPVNFTRWLPPISVHHHPDNDQSSPAVQSLVQAAVRHIAVERRGLHWIIVGGESGPGARPCNVEWIRSAVAQCHAAYTPVFCKQLGAKVIWPHAERGVRLTDRKGGDMDEWPADLRVREMPQ